FCRRAQAGETPGSPRLPGRDRSHSFTDTHFGHGAPREHGCLVRSTIGRRAVRGRRPLLEGTPKTLTRAPEAAGWDGGCSGAEVLIRPLPLPGHETGRGGGP